MEQTYSNTKKTKWKQIDEKKRYQIEILLKEGKKTFEIAELLGYSQRTIQREIARGKVKQLKSNQSFKKNEPDVLEEFVYCADYAQARHEEAGANKGPGLKIGHDHALVDFIEHKIKDEKWSPEAVIGYIKENGLTFKVSICIKTLYNYIDRDLFLHISNKDLLFKKDSPKKVTHRVRTVSLNNRSGQSIDKRPEEANNRSEIGHWELDLVIGKQGTKPVILTLVERKSRKSIYILVRNKTQLEVLKAIRRAKKRVGGDFSGVIKTITTDNGPEFLDGAGIKRASGCDEVYYAHPYCSWEKGSNENGNRILRRFLPKGTDFSKITRKELQRIEDWVNNYPRRIFGYKTANDIYTEELSKFAA